MRHSSPLSDTHLTTQSAVIDRLGGNPAVADLCSTSEEPVTAKAVSNWRKVGFPAKTYVVMQQALKGIGCTAPDALWNIIPVSEARRRA
jgi:hypothetical protein